MLLDPTLPDALASGATLQHLMPPTRAEALARLATFLPRAGSTYAAKRNHDFGPTNRTNVSVLSPYIRHRLITEEEVIRHVRSRFAYSTAEKFIQEVVWRTYWKGWLEQRPAVWTRYLDHLAAQSNQDIEPSARARLHAAETGDTGIVSFDHWMRELTETGYLHNHARMWAASIWIFTLGLPWQRGADHFLRHLKDGDPASNTLSWRWVAGLHTRGKTYLARPDNIDLYTSGRFPSETRLAREALPLEESDPLPPRRPLAPLPQEAPAGPVIWIGTEDDLGVETWPVGRATVTRVLLLDTSAVHPHAAPSVIAFKAGAISDAADRARRQFAVPVDVLDVRAPDAAATLATLLRTSSPVLLEMPVGHAAAAVGALYAHSGAPPPIRLRRRWDDLVWPHATAGFFKVKDRIPAILDHLGVGA